MEHAGLHLLVLWLTFVGTVLVGGGALFGWSVRGVRRAPCHPEERRPAIRTGRRLFTARPRRRAGQPVGPRAPPRWRSLMARILAAILVSALTVSRAAGPVWAHAIAGNRV